MTALLAQTPPEAPQKTGSLSGVVRDASAGGLLPGIQVLVVGGSQTTTDAQGRFAFEKVEPGARHVTAWDTTGGAYGGTYVSIGPGQAATVEIRLKLGGSIAGRVLDENRQPVAGAIMLLLSKRYEFGELSFLPDRAVTADRDGAYRLEGVFPERAFLILAKKPLKALVSKDEQPADPEQRERVLLPALYPNARDMRSAQTVTLAPGETRSGVDIVMATAPSYCIEGAVDRVGDAKELSVSLTERLSFGSGWSLAPATVAVKPDGQFRACGLHPGAYHLSASSATTDRALYAVADAIVTDRDVADLKLLGRSAPTISGEVKFDPPPREKPRRIEIALMRYSHGGSGYADSVETPANFRMAGGFGTGARVSDDGSFELGRTQVADWQLRVTGLPQDCYLKEASFGNQNVLHAPLRLAQALGGERLHLAIACDGGALTVRVADKDGNPVSHVALYLVPADAASEGALADGLQRIDVWSGWSAPLTALPPGKYLAVATELDISPLDAPADRIEKLWNARSEATPVEIGSGAAVQITLAPLSLD